MNNTWLKIFIIVITATVLGTTAVMWKMPFANAREIQLNKIELEKIKATQEERWNRTFEILSEIKLRQERIEAKVDALGYQK